jgi:EmrB/QacA subfamily drug resistance transporter
MSLPIFILTIDFFGITVALPSIGHDLRTSTTALEWTVNAFMLGFAAPLLAVGRLGDIVGRRKVLQFGVALFAVGSALCGAAQSDVWLIAARALQGAGCSMFFANSLSIVSNAFPVEQRGVGIGIWSSVGTVGSAVGPLFGGILSQFLSWHWFFFINIPIAIAAFILTASVVPESRDESVTRIDWLGFVTVTAGFVLLVMGIELIDAMGLGSPTVIGLIVAGSLLLALFAVVELRVSSPMVEFELFENRSFVGSAGVAFIGNYVFGAMTFFMTLYLQHVLNYSPVVAGAVFLAYTLPFIPLSTVAGRQMKPWGARLCMALGMSFLTASFVALAFINVASGVALTIAGFILHSIGQAYAYNVSTAAAMNLAPEQKAGEVSGLVGTLRMIGIVFGVAITGALFKQLEKMKMFDMFAALGKALTAAQRSDVRGLLSGSADAQAKLAALVPDAAQAVESIVRTSFVHALDGVMILCCTMSAVGIGCALMVKREL